MYATGPFYNEIYNPEALMARVGHLSRSQRRDIEHITRIIRVSFDGAGILHPKPRITKIMLTGRYARRTWGEEEDPLTTPAYDVWIIVNDRLLSRKRLWQATTARLEAELGDRCRVNLSFTSAAALKAGKRNGDEYILERMRSSITLYRAKRDDPISRKGKSAGTWAEALASYEAGQAAFLPASATFRDADRDYFAAVAEHRDGKPISEDRARQIHATLEAATAEEKRLGTIAHGAGLALLHTPAPDLGAVIRKLELVRDEGDSDDHAIVSILADVRWIARRLAEQRRRP
ncbi:hypothetical protein [Sphingomonas abietis]|uniref:Nucleotidyltransferase n=1 Tax=Sphingomonas abietis TaxID=3012344 RepID=A0ABY7NX55_9SPHN|nr:hypothetical protein [Sphingomonas abietis]WBO24494.1 hypothetical protein PBT88_10520 [Sphingomonas abietis]